MIRPIILIGMNRSGTKWLSNIICGHEAVIGVQGPRFGGILETNMFGPMQEKFDLRSPDEYIGIVELWSRTEFFRIAGLDPQMFYELDPRPRNVLQLFELAMNELARKNGCAFWLQKTSPVNAPAVLEYFTNARIVVIRRNLADNVRSTLALQSRRRSPRPFHATYRYVYQDKLLDRICRQHPVVPMRYEDLKANTERETARLFADLGLCLPRNPQPLAFPRNTSFASDAQREKALPRRERLLLRSIASCIYLLPLPVISAAIGLKRLLLGRRPQPLLADSFGEIGDRLVDRSWGEDPAKALDGR